MVLRAPAGAVFDLDGTLVLTEARNAQVWRTFLGRYDVPLTPDRLTAVTGRRGRDSLAELSAGVAAVVAAGLTCVAVLTHATAGAVAAAHAVLDDLTHADRLGWSLPAAAGA